MAINKPRIAGKPATERRRVQGVQPIEVVPAAPGETVRTLDSNGAVTQVQAPTPEIAGQIYIYKFVDESGLNRRANAYVAVDINGTLTWKVVAGQTFLLNSYTGKPYDPIYDG